MRPILTMASLSLCLSLSGCAAYERYVAEREAAAAAEAAARQALYEQKRQQISNAQAACALPYADPKTEALRTKIPAPPQEPSLRQLGDTARPTARQKKALEVMDTLLADCHVQQAAIEALDRPVTHAAYVNYGQRLRSLVSTLWAGKLTFGQFNQGQQQLVADYAQERTALLQQQEIVNAQYRAARAAEAAQLAAERAAASAAAPKHTTCKQKGKETRCTTY
ncbi:Uncharacterised protein [Bordetella ansorpii]|uniref:Lipoprotein n=1 Tax=Bordetella ansorpii TaxID=288768 RepID=A0A157S682_9BORD|nr:hypothetical protein [Bordetella ansorpii]SAI65912.1 Uncharacterised protein [Bordetella ansorpii]